MKNLKILLILFMMSLVKSQAQDDRIKALDLRLEELSQQIKGLKDPIDFSVSGVSIQEFLRGIAETNGINISVDPSLDIKVYNNFTNESVKNVLLFLCKEYSLDIRAIGTIISIVRFVPTPEAPLPPKAKEFVVKFNSYANLLTLDLKNDTLEAVAKKITQVTKKNVILSNGTKNTLLNAYIEDMPFDGALEKMAYANKLKVVKTTDNFYVIKPLDESDEVLEEAGNTKSKTKKTGNKGKTPNQAGSQNFNNHGGSNQNNSESSLEINISGDSLKPKISVEAINTPINEIIKNVFAESGGNYFLFSEIKGNTTTNISNVGIDELMSNLLKGTEYTFKQEGKVYLIGERKLEGLRTNKVVQLHFRSIESVQETIPAELRKGVEIKEFKELNSVLLSGSSPQIIEIENFIKQIDKVVPMVLLEVIIIDVKKGKSVSTGIKAGLDSSAKTGGTLFPGLNAVFSSKSINEFLSFIGINNLFNIGKVSPKFYVQLSALEDNNNVEVRSTPKLSTLNGHNASLSIGSTRYYSLKTQNVVGSLTPQTVVTEQYNAVNANLTVNITPLVSGDDQVTLNIDVNITDFTDSPNSGPPPSATSQFKSIIRVKNEDMLVLGGLERFEKSEKGSGVPILSRIPVLKWFFSSRSRSRSKTVSVVFVKPTIIY